MTLFQTDKRCKAEKQWKAGKCYEGCVSKDQENTWETLLHKHFPQEMTVGWQPVICSKGTAWVTASSPGQGFSGSGHLSFSCPDGIFQMLESSQLSLSFNMRDCFAFTQHPHLSHHLLPFGSLLPDTILLLEPGWANLTPTCLHAVCQNLMFWNHSWNRKHFSEKLDTSSSGESSHRPRVGICNGCVRFSVSYPLTFPAVRCGVNPPPSKVDDRQIMPLFHWL